MFVRPSQKHTHQLHCSVATEDLGLQRLVAQLKHLVRLGNSLLRVLGLVVIEEEGQSQDQLDDGEGDSMEIHQVRETGLMEKGEKTMLWRTC